MPMPKQICDECASLFAAAHAEPNGLSDSKPREVSSMSRSQKDCLTCAWLLAKVLKGNPDFTGRIDMACIKRMEDIRPEHFAFMFRWSFAGAFALGLLSVFIQPERGMRNDIQFRTADGSTLHTARAWERHCSSQHDRCHAERLPGSTPARLVHLRRSTHGSIAARLHEASAKHYDRTVQYIALSHRWLDGDPYIHVQANHDSLLFEIPVSFVKPAIRDAMIFTLSLGLEYIWVDSLCIIQDSVSDKAAEIASMRKIYANAHLTIAAATSENRCFTTRDPSNLAWAALSPHQLRSISASSESETISERPQYILRRGWFESRSLTEMNHCKLWTRAWCFQERFLSPRMLHFCDSQVYWNCRQMAASEQWQEGFPQEYFLSEDSLGEAVGRWALDRIAKENSSRGWTEYRIWENIVELFSSADLTYAGDRLDAIAGVAAWFEKVCHEGYYWGHWQRDLPCSLLWRVLLPGEAQAVAGTSMRSVAPSWSWGSVTDRVAYGAVGSGWPQGGSGRFTEESYREMLVTDLTTDEQLRTRQVCMKGLPWASAIVLKTTTTDKATAVEEASLEGVSHTHRAVLDASGHRLPLSVLCLSVLRQLQSRKWFERGLLLVSSSVWDGAFERVGYYQLEYGVEQDNARSLGSAEQILRIV